MISSILLVLDEQEYDQERVTSAAQLAAPLDARVVATSATSDEPNVARTEDAIASRVRVIVRQLPAAGMTAGAATGSALHDSERYFVAVAAAEHADVIIPTTHNMPCLHGAAPPVALQGGLSSHGLVTVVRMSQLNEPRTDGAGVEITPATSAHYWNAGHRLGGARPSGVSP
jgi:hypothetical protein